LTNDKRYIGSTSNMERRWSQHRRLLKRNLHENPILQFSYNKHGENNFIYELLELCSESNLIEIEDKYIRLFDTMNRNHGYNFDLPSRPNQSPEANEKRRLAMTGRKMSEKQRIQMSIDRTGKKHTPEHKAATKLAIQNRTQEEKEAIYKKISEANKGKIMSQEARRKIGLAHLGTKYSEESKTKMSEAHKGSKNPNYGRTGEHHWHYGKHFSSETKEKMRLAHSGSNNHNYGKPMSEEQKQKISETKKRQYQEKLLLKFNVNVEV